MPEDTWFSRDLPVLEAAVALLEEQMATISSPKQVANRTGLAEEDVLRALIALDGRYLEMKWLDRRKRIGHIQGATPAAREATGQWPTADSLASRVLETLDERIEHATPKERPRWVQIRDAVSGAGRDLLVDVMGAVITRQITSG